MLSSGRFRAREPCPGEWDEILAWIVEPDEPYSPSLSPVGANLPRPTVTRLHIVRQPTEIPEFTDLESLAAFFHTEMHPWHDTLEDVSSAMDYAFSDAEGKGGFLLLAEHAQELVGGLLMLETGMGGYVPAHILLFVAVKPAVRGQGIGRKLVDKGLDLAGGPVKLHVEYNNPAKRLYERVGFQSKYAEMRYLP
jgi:[ribosomal protein S18]-alanine N-acetyltransferase